MLGPQYWHFIAAAYMTAGFLVASVYAVGWLRGRRDRYHRLGFLVPFTVAAVVTPIQMGDRRLRSPARCSTSSRRSSPPSRSCWRPGRTRPEYLYGRLQPDGTVAAASGFPGSTRSWPASAGTPWCRA